MRLHIALLIATWVYLVHSSTMNPARVQGLLARFRRDSHHQLEVNTRVLKTVKTNARISKDDPPSKHNLPPLRKGEYYCGDRVCKLTSKQLAKSCHGVCKYPV